MNDCCLTLLCPPLDEEKLLDLLLMFAHSAVFTSAPVAAHGVSVGRLSASEQVLGRARATQVQVLLPVAAKDVLLASIRAQFAGVGVRYWVTPLLEMEAIA